MISGVLLVGVGMLGVVGGLVAILALSDVLSEGYFGDGLVRWQVGFFNLIIHLLLTDSPAKLNLS